MILQTLKQIKKNPLLFTAIAVIDALFFMAYGFFTNPIKEKIVEHGVLISNEISLQIAQREPAGALTYLLSPSVMPNLTKVLMLMGMLYAIIYLVYTIFQGTTWWITKKITQQTTFSKYFLGFAKINLLWIGSYAIYKTLDVIIGVRHAIILKFAPEAINTGGYLILAIFLLTAVAAIISYPTLKIKQIIKIPIKKTMMLILTSIAFYLIAKGIITITAKYVPFKASMLIALAILFPTIAFIKIYTTNMVTNADTHN